MSLDFLEASGECRVSTAVPGKLSRHTGTFCISNLQNINQVKAVLSLMQVQKQCQGQTSKQHSTAKLGTTVLTFFMCPGPQVESY